jgi:hypothetical protein
MGFHDLKTYWHMDHPFVHQPVAIEAVLGFLIMAVNLFYAFLFGHLRPAGDAIYQSVSFKVFRVEMRGPFAARAPAAPVGRRFIHESCLAVLDRPSAGRYGPRHRRRRSFV